MIRALRAVPEDLRPIVAYLIQTYIYDERTLREIIRAVKPEEIDAMMSQFAQDIIDGKPKWLEMVRQESLKEGRQKEGAKLLLRQLSRRFQPLPDEIPERVRGADPNAIERWADRILDAKSLDEVFRE